MKSLALFAILAFAAVGIAAQDAPQKPATPPPPGHAMHHGQMGDMHSHMMSMQDQATKMRDTLEKMKANVAKISDPAAKQHAQYDVDLWEQMVQHMEGMAKMHSGMMGMGMHHGDMSAPHADKPAAPDKK